MITSDTNFRGNFDSIEAVWEAIPYGGVEGDYLNIQGVKYRWNKYLAMWENAEVVTETPARETVTFDEDVNMQNNLTVAGVLRAKEIVAERFRAWNPKGNYDATKVYSINDLVYDTNTKAAYLSMRSNNIGHPVDENDESYEEGWWMEVQTIGVPKGDFSLSSSYNVGDIVYDSDTNSSYLSLRADNTGHPVDENDEEYEEGWWMKVLNGSYVNLLEEELQQLVDSISEGTQQQIEELNEALEALEAQADQSRQDIQDIVDSLAVVQTTGQSTSSVMSQKAVTDSLCANTISFENPLNGDTTDNVQRALDEVRGDDYNLLNALGMSDSTTAVLATAPKNVVTEYPYTINKGDRFRIRTVKNSGTTSYSVSTRNGSTTIERILNNVNTNQDIIFQTIGDADRFAVFSGNGTLGLTITKISKNISIDDYPTNGSVKPVKSGGIYSSTPSIANGQSDSDLDIVDETNNVLARFSDGHVQTKNFNSADVTIKVKNNNNFDFTIEDEVGNAIVLFQNGHIRTKNFNSQTYSAGNYLIDKFQGKKIAIIGDSISTYQGWLPSDVSGFSGTTYATYYPQGDVNSVDKTWWYQVAINLGIKTIDIANTSWSGSTVCGNSTSTTSGVAACSTKRINDIAIHGFTPDIILIYIGCNDWYQCGLAGYNITLGTWAITDSVPAEGTITAFRSAYALMISKIQNAYPNARIFCCTILDDWRRDGIGDDPSDNAWPSNDGAGYTTKQWNDNIKEIADAFACDVIDMHNCGITYFNIQNYAVDAGLHPNAAGHAMMARKVTSELMAKY